MDFLIKFGMIEEAVRNFVWFVVRGVVFVVLAYCFKKTKNKKTEMKIEDPSPLSQ